MSTHQRNTEPVSSRPWINDRQPGSFLIVRLHAIGDVAITLPYCAALRKRYPNARIDFLTTEACADLPRSLTIFDTVYALPYGETRWSRLSSAFTWGVKIFRRRYDVVLDLQHNWVSKILKSAGRPEAWAEFNRTEPKSAGERTHDTFTAAGFSVVPQFGLPVASHLLARAEELLKMQGWSGSAPLIVLNPAGLFPTRNWPIENYLRLAQLWLQQEPVQFLLLGTTRTLRQSSYLQNALGETVVNLTGATSLAEAFAVLQFASGIVSEDSGLMHMAWVSGIPTLALFGSSRHDWSRPLGSQSVCLHSGDLECGACMSSTCRYGDVHCLTRYTPEYVYETARGLFSTVPKESSFA